MKLGKSVVVIGLVGAALLTAGCGGGGKEPETPVSKAKAAPEAAPVIDKEAENKFNVALEAFNDHDKKTDWSDATCAQVASLFQAAATQQRDGKLAVATYDAALAYQRCGDDKNAKPLFEKALQPFN